MKEIALRLALNPSAIVHHKLNHEPAKLNHSKQKTGRRSRYPSNSNPDQPLFRQNVSLSHTHTHTLSLSLSLSLSCSDRMSLSHTHILSLSLSLSLSHTHSHTQELMKKYIPQLLNTIEKRRGCVTKIRYFQNICVLSMCSYICVLYILINTIEKRRETLDENGNPKPQTQNSSPKF